MAFLSSYSYRKSVTLSRASGAVTNYQMKILVGESSGSTGKDVDCGYGCKADFSDVRFTAADGTTLLDYWIESISGITPTQTATIWVEFNSIGTTATTFYLYYGSPSASSVSNGDNTFLLFDHFTGTTINSSKWTMSASPTVSNSLLLMDASTEAIDSIVLFATNTRFRSLLKYASNNAYTQFGFADSGNYTNFYHVNFPTASVINANNRNPYPTETASNLGNNYSNAYNIFEVIRNAATSAIYAVNGTTVATITTSNPSGRSLPIHFLGWNNVTTVDWVFVSQYLSPEPMWGTWGAVELPGSTVSNPVSLPNQFPKIDKVRVYTELTRTITNFTFETFATGTATAAYIGNGTLPKLTGTILPTTWITITDPLNILRIVRNGSSIDISIPLGNALSPVYVAHAITNKIKSYGLWCEFLNCIFNIRSRTVSDTLSIGTPSNNIAGSLGLSAATFTAGGTITNTYAGTATFNSTYLGLTQATYWVKVSGNDIFTVTPGSSNYYKGTVTAKGNFPSANAISYQITVNALQGNMAENGKTFSPTFSVSSTYGDSVPVSCELLYYNHWYEVGNYGVRIKFSEYPFQTGDTFQIDCLPPQTADGTNATATAATAKFIVLSTDGTGITTPTLLNDGVLPLSKGMSISFSSGTFNKGDTFIVNGFGPTYTEVTPIDIGIAGLGEQGAYGFSRLIIKEGAHRLSWCKIGLKTVGAMLDYNYGESMFDMGTLGVNASKNSCELPQTFTADTVPAQMASHVSYMPIDSFIDIGCGSPIFASDFWYFSLQAGLTEATQEFYPAFIVYYNYR